MEAHPSDEGDPPRDPSLPGASAFYEFCQVRPDVFETNLLSTAHQNSERAAYGGLVFSQALAAAEATVSEEFKPHNVSSYFILGLDTKKPVEYVVRRLRDGKSFCNRGVDAVQEGRVAFSMLASFHVLESSSIVHQSAMPKVKAPDELLAIRAAGRRLRAEVEAGRLRVNQSVLDLIEYRLSNDIFDDKNALFEIRPVQPERYYSIDIDSHEMQFWFRLRKPLDSEDPRLHRYLCMFATDSVPAGTAIRAHQGNGLKVSMIFTLSHSMAIHTHEVRADSWHLYSLKSTQASGGRAFVEGRWWSHDGRLIMSITQELLVRTRGEPSIL